MGTGVERLRRSWRIVGHLIGALPQNPRQNNQLGLPLVLLPEEVALLLHEGLFPLYSACTCSHHLMVSGVLEVHGEPTPALQVHGEPAPALQVRVSHTIITLPTIIDHAWCV